MCELFGLSSSRRIAVDAWLGAFAQRGGAVADNPDGWGVAYRWAGGFVVEKDTNPGAESVRLAELGRRLVADLVIAHVRKANPPTALTLDNTHPFVRGCCGRQWAFAHNGKVEAILGPDPCCRPYDCRFSGATDSEQAFCYLLQEIARVLPEAADPVDKAWFGAAAEASALVAAYGQFNFLLTDGTYLLAHAHDRLQGLTLERSGAALVALVASEPLPGAAAAWQPLGPHRLHVYRDGRQIAALPTMPAAAAAPVSERIQQNTSELCHERPLCSE